MRTLNDYFLTSSLEGTGGAPGQLIIGIPDEGTITEVRVVGTPAPSAAACFANINVGRSGTETSVKDSAGALQATLEIGETTSVAFATGDNEVVAGDYVRCSFNSAAGAGTVTTCGITLVIRR